MGQGRKIYNKLVIDIETGAILEEDSFVYSGPLARCEGADDGEKGDSGDGGEDMDADFINALSEVEIDIDEFKEPDDKGGDEGKVKKKEGNAVDDELTEKEKALLAENERLKADKNGLKKALHEERQEKKGKKSDGNDGDTPTLSDAQLKALLEEHRDDPDVLMNIIKYKVEQVAKGMKKDAMSEVDMQQKKAQVDQFMKTRYPDYDDEDSDVRRGLAPVKKALGLDDHPFGDYFAAGVQVLNSLPDIVKHWFEEGKKAAVGDTANEKRKEQIKDGQLSPSGKKTDDDKYAQGLTASQLDTAKRLGFKTKQQLTLYRDQILKNSPKKKEG